MPSWPFGRRTKQSVSASPSKNASSLDEIDASTPHRFRFWLANAADRDRAVAALSGLNVLELRFELFDETDGRVGLEVASTFSPRTAAVLRPLHALDRAGVAASGFEPLDLVTELDEGTLRRLVGDWDSFGNTGPYRHRLEILAGSEVIERCLGQETAARQQTEAQPRWSAWRFAACCAAVNTPGSEALLLRAAVRARDEHDAHSFIVAVSDRATLTGLTETPFELAEDPLVSLIGRRSYVGEQAAFLAQAMRGPLSESITTALCAAARAGGDAGSAALAALHNAAPSPEVRGTVDDALASGEPNRQATALVVLAHHWGVEARPAWQAFLASRSGPLRQTAEAVLGLHGTIDDLPDAAARMRMLARAKSAIHMVPPRGHEIVDLLVRFRDVPVARAALDDLSARWGRLGDDLREWLEQAHPWLDPSSRLEATLIEQDAEPEAPLNWPLPRIEREGEAFVLWFDETDLFETRERFDDLAHDHPSVEVIDGDREWTSLRVLRGDPESLIGELWAAAGRARADA